MTRRYRRTRQFCCITEALLASSLTKSNRIVAVACHASSETKKSITAAERHDSQGQAMATVSRSANLCAVIYLSRRQRGLAFRPDAARHRISAGEMLIDAGSRIRLWRRGICTNQRPAFLDVSSMPLAAGATK